MGKNSFDGDIKKKMILLTLALFVLVCYIVYNIPCGCHGTCQQGRKPCDCKDKDD